MNWNDAVEFSFEGEFKEAKVLEVYDGDTITVAFPFGGKYRRSFVLMVPCIVF